MNATKNYKLRRSKDYKRPVEIPMIALIGSIAIVFLSIVIAFLWQFFQENDSPNYLSSETVPVTEDYDDPRLIITDPFTEVEAIANTVEVDPNRFHSGISYVQRELFSTSVPPNETAVDNSYFDTALFLGDSFTLGIPNNLAGAYNGFHVVGTAEFSLSTALEYSGYEGANRQPSTFPDLVSEAGNAENFERIYIMVGQNDNSLSPEQFKEKYTAFSLEVRSLFPDATIYLQGLIPSLDPMFNGFILERNLLIMNIANDTASYFLDTSSVFSNDEGGLLEMATPDGDHITGEYYYRWFDYIKHHTV